MAFGYALLKGRGGAAGYVRDSGGQREVSARNIKPGTVCSLYTIQDGKYSLCGTETADSGGNAKWTAPKEGGLLIIEGNKVLLWDGGDDAFLAACAWLEKQSQRNVIKPEPTPEADIPEARTEAREPAPPPEPEKIEEKESPPERAYTLRPAGDGEPVDTLPERQRK
ncbi:MAG: hypothetical protein IJQ62_03520 [Clostridia bacterium]|nr:hypothetical protein [Clostridia bacterium]